MPCGHSYLQVNFYKRFDGAVSITVVLKESENKVEGLSQRLRVRAPVKPFFYFLFFAFAKSRNYSRFTCLQKKACSDVLCTCRATSLSKMARLVKKRNLEWNCYWIVYGTGLQHSLALADLPLRKLWKRSRRHMTSSSLGPVVNILAIFSYANILKNIREQKDAT